MITDADVDKFRALMDEATTAVYGTANIYDISKPADRLAFVKSRRAWINAHANSLLPGWNDPGIDLPGLDQIRALSMSDWDFSVSYFNTSIGELPFDPVATAKIGQRVASPLSGNQDQSGNVRYVVADTVTNPRAAYYQRPWNAGIGASLFSRPVAPVVVFKIRTYAEYLTDPRQGYSSAERVAWMGSHLTDVAKNYAAMSYLAQGFDAKVTPPPAYAIYNVYGGTDNLHRNLTNTNIYYQAVYDQAVKVASGKDIMPVAPGYAVAANDSNFLTKNSKLILGAFEIALMFYALPAALGTNPFAKDIATAKNLFSDPVGATTTIAKTQVEKAIVKQIAPALDVVNFVVDPAGYVKDKVTGKVLYPLAHPEQWAIDESKKYVHNVVTGEVRDAITGAIVGKATPAGRAALNETQATIPIETVAVDTRADISAAPAKTGTLVLPLGMLLALMFS